MHTSYSGSVSGTAPLSTCTASRTSSAFPTAMPSGWFISVITAATRFPTSAPISTIRSASAFASSGVSMNAPVPVLTSSTIASDPDASFLLITLDAISGMLRTVAVTSLSA